MAPPSQPAQGLLDRQQGLRQAENGVLRGRLLLREVLHGVGGIAQAYGRLAQADHLQGLPQLAGGRRGLTHVADVLRGIAGIDVDHVLEMGQLAAGGFGHGREHGLVGRAKGGAIRFAPLSRGQAEGPADVTDFLGGLRGSGHLHQQRAERGVDRLRGPAPLHQGLEVLVDPADQRLARAVGGQAAGAHGLEQGLGRMPEAVVGVVGGDAPQLVEDVPELLEPLPAAVTTPEPPQQRLLESRTVRPGMVVQGVVGLFDGAAVDIRRQLRQGEIGALHGRGPAERSQAIQCRQEDFGRVGVTGSQVVEIGRQLQHRTHEGLHARRREVGLVGLGHGLQRQAKLLRQPAAALHHGHVHHPREGGELAGGPLEPCGVTFGCLLDQPAKAFDRFVDSFAKPFEGDEIQFLGHAHVTPRGSGRAPATPGLRMVSADPGRNPAPPRGSTADPLPVTARHPTAGSRGA